MVQVYFQYILSLQEVMGNVSDNRANPLAKNWLQVAPNTYKNLITDELIDSHELLVHSDEELSFNNNLLMKRAALCHPNVLKLIYFCHSPASTLCSTVKHAMKIYLEHQTSTLADLFRSQQHKQSQSATSLNNSLCICCSLVSGAAYLADKYGFFQVQEDMVWISGEKGFKSNPKAVPKVWIHSDIKCNQPQNIASQGQMCQQLVLLLASIGHNNLCKRLQALKDLPVIQKLAQLVGAVYGIHCQSIPSQPRKRTQTQYSRGQGQEYPKPAGGDSGPMFMPKEGHFILMNMKKERLSNGIKAIDRSIVQSGSNGQSSHFDKQSSNPFSKISFRYTQYSQTPKQGKNQIIPSQGVMSSKQPTKNKSESPMQAIQLLASSKRAGVSEANTAQSIISKFNPGFRPQESDLIISQEQADSKLKQLLQTERNQTNYIKTISKEAQKASLERDPPQTINPNTFQAAQGSYNVGSKKQLGQESRTSNHDGEDRRKQLNLRMQRNLEVSYENSSKISIQSLGSKNNDRVTKFGIVNQYRISVKPKAVLDEFQMQSSKEYAGSEFEVTNREKSVIADQSLKSNHSNALQSSFERQELRPSFQGARSGKNLKEVSQPLKKGYSTYLKNFKEVTLTESKLQHSNAPHSDRNDFYTEVSGKTTSNPIHLASSNGLKDRRFDSLGQKSKKMELGDTPGMLERDLRLQMEIESLYSQASEEESRKAKIMAKINNTEQVLRENRKKLQRLQLEKDLQVQKSIIKRQMESLLVNNLMVDQSHRIKEKVQHKKATFAQLKAEASKILEDLNF